MVHQLIDAGIQESHELDFADRPEPLRRHAHAESPDQSFRQRRVENALGTKALLQAGGCAEHAAIDTDIFAEDHNIRIIHKRPSERQIDRVYQRHLRHWGSRFPYAGRHRRLAVWRKDGRTSFLADAGRSPDSARWPPSLFARTRW